MKHLLSILLIAIMISSSSFSQLEKQTVNKFEKEIRLTLSANYLLYLPEDYKNSDKNFPLVLFLHGAGERGTDIEKVKVHGLPKLINEGKEFPFIVVSPQCPDNIFWNTDLLAALLNDIEANYRIDKNNIYIPGLSMDGHGNLPYNNQIVLLQLHRFADGVVRLKLVK